MHCSDSSSKSLVEVWLTKPKHNELRRKYGATWDGNKKLLQQEKRKRRFGERGMRKQKIKNRNPFLRKGRNLREGKEKQHSFTCRNYILLVLLVSSWCFLVFLPYLFLDIVYLDMYITGIFWWHLQQGIFKNLIIIQKGALTVLGWEKKEGFLIFCLLLVKKAIGHSGKTFSFDQRLIEQDSLFFWWLK